MKADDFWDGPDSNEPTKPAIEPEDTFTQLRFQAEDTLKPEPRGFALVVYAGNQLGRLFPVNAGDNTIGRSPSARISLADEEISRIHACLSLLQQEGQDLLFLEDRDSTNGTRVNAVPIKGRRQVFPGDRIMMGIHVLKILAMDALERNFHETLLDQSTRDPLTGLANRGTTLQELQNRVELSRRHGRALAVVMCDLDHFKIINDTHGHGVGDMVLKTFGDRVRSNLRGTDLAGRIGGEEFLLVLPETELEGALNLAERLRVALCDHPVPVAGSMSLNVTASLGVAQLLDEDRDGGALLARADHALYQAKRSGRNRIAYREL